MQLARVHLLVYAVVTIPVFLLHNLSAYDIPSSYSSKKFEVLCSLTQSDIKTDYLFMALVVSLVNLSGVFGLSAMAQDAFDAKRCGSAVLTRWSTCN